MNRNELNDLIDRFHNSLINLHESAFLSLDFSKNNKLQRNDSLKTFSQHSQIVLLIKLNKLIAMKTRKNYKKILLIQGSIISDEKQYEFRQFKIFFTAFIDFLQKNLVVDKFYLISDLRPKLLKREDIGKIKELVFKSTKTTKGFNFFLYS